MARRSSRVVTMGSQLTYVSLKFYDEQLPDGWEVTIRKIKNISKGKWQVVAIKHDSDTLGDDYWEPSIEKPHYHVLVKVMGHAPRVSIILNELGIVYRKELDEELWKNHGCEVIEDWISMVTYLLHLTDQAIKDGKHPYKREELVSNLTLEEIDEIMSSYVHEIKNTDLKALDKEAYELGLALGDFEKWYQDLDFEIRKNSSMKTIKESYENGVTKKVEERVPVVRLCVFIQGNGNEGKTYASAKALEGKRFLIPPPGSGKFDSLKASTEAIIIDDESCPNLLNMADNYICRAYKRNNGSPPWTGNYLVVTSNKSFEEWVKDCGVKNPENIKAVRTRFYICYNRKVKGGKHLVCSSPSNRGTSQEQEKRNEMFIEFKKKYEATISAYTPRDSQDNFFEINSEEDIVFELERKIDELKRNWGELIASPYENALMENKKKKKIVQLEMEIEYYTDLLSEYMDYSIYEDEIEDIVFEQKNDSITF